MKTVFNRFAILPKHCPDCHRYIWLEKYRRAYVWRKDNQGYIKQNICSDCIKKYVGDLNGRRIMNDGKHTRLEQIRQMKAEEMAEWLHNIVHFADEDGEMIVTLLEPKTDNNMEICDSFGDWLEWLNVEAKPEEMK